MSSLDLPAPVVAAPRAMPAAEFPFPVIVLFGLAATLLLGWPQITRFWADGIYADTDDAMRMVQVRDWMSGQGWFDLRAMRLDGGVTMHWSRVVDVPLALLIRLFGLFAAPETADRLARLAFPLSLQVALLVATASAGRLLAGIRGAMVAVALTVTSGFMFGQFVPGRIDHHAPQIVLLVAMATAGLAALDPARPRMAVLSGLCASLSLAIAVENLPFVIILAAVFPLAWMIRGAPLRAALGWFGAGFGLGLPLCFALFQSPSLWFAPACDALSIVHVSAAMAGGFGMGLIALYDRWRAPGFGGRIVATAAAGLFAAIPLLIHRQCLIDPFVGIDPLVREMWLANVTEARSIPTHLALFPDSWGMLVMPWALGTLACLLAAVMETGVARARWFALTGLCLAGSATAFYMIRSIASVAPLALLGGVWAATRTGSLLEKSARGLALCGMVAAALPFATFFWVVVMPAEDNPAEAARQKYAATCRAPSAFASLAGLPAGLMLAPIDSGSHLLVHTPHAVMGAPYHRNNHGNRFVLDAFLAAPAAAADLVRAAGVRYVVLCPKMNQVTAMAQRAPDGLAARLAAGETPEWLHEIPLGESPYRAFAVGAP